MNNISIQDVKRIIDYTPSQDEQTDYDALLSKIAETKLFTDSLKEGKINKDWIQKEIVLLPPNEPNIPLDRTIYTRCAYLLNKAGNPQASAATSSDTASYISDNFDPLALSIAKYTEALSTDPEANIDDYIPENTPPELIRKIHLIGEAIKNTKLTIPYRRNSFQCLKPLLHFRLEKYHLKTEMIKLLELMGVLSEDQSNPNYMKFSFSKLNKYLENVYDNHEKIKLRALFSEFQYDINPEKSDQEAWQLYDQSHPEAPPQWKDTLVDHGSLTLQSDPAFGRPAWWTESGAVGDAFKTQYGLGTGSIRKVPYVVLRDILFSIRDLFQFIFIVPERVQAFKQYIDNPTIENLKEMFKSGFLPAFFTSLFDIAVRLVAFNPHAIKEIKACLKQLTKENLTQLLQKWPGLLTGVFLVISLAVVNGSKFLIINPRSLKEYKALWNEPSLQNLKNLLLSNPGVLGGILMTAGYSVQLLFKTLIWNPTAEVTKHLAPATSEEDSIKNTFAVFQENPGLLFAVMSIAGKYLLFNPSTSKEYQTYLSDNSPQNLANLWKANPGLISGALMTLEFVFGWTFRTLIWNPTAEVGKHLTPAKSEEDSINNTFSVFKENPGILFAAIAIAGKYLLFNSSASTEYAAYLYDRSPESFGNLWKANPGLIMGSLMSLEFVFEWGLRTLIWNPTADVGKHLTPAKSEDDSIKNTFSVFKENPGLLFAVVAIAGKYLLFNSSASHEYGAYLHDRSPESFKNLWKANPGLIMGSLMSLEFVFEWGLRTLIWNPTADVGKHLTPAKSEDDSIKNTFSVFKENPGILFATIAIAGKYLLFNSSASHEYGAYLHNRSPESFKNLWKANPGLIIGSLMSLEFVFEWGLRSLIWNPVADVKKHLAPAKSEDDSIKNTFAVFKENPGILFAVIAIAGKYLVFNPSASTEYSTYLKDNSPQNLANLWKANPGVIAGSMMALEFVFGWTFRTLIWNPTAEVGKHLAPPTSEEDSIKNTFAVFKENPGILFATIAIAGKYLLFNPSASREYRDFAGDRSPQHFADLWKANPGLISGSLMTLEFTFEWGLRSLIWNPTAEVAKHLAPPTSEEDSIKNTFAVFKENPGILFATITIAGKYLLFNPSASHEYGAFVGDRSPQHFADLWKANPGLISGSLMTLEFVFEWGLRSIIWNPTADVKKHLAPASKDDSIKNTLSVFKENPGVLFAVMAIAGKYLLFNASASKEYQDYLIDRSPQHLASLWKVNPGLIGGSLMAIEFVLEWGFRSLIWNPSVDYGKYLAPATSEEDNIQNSFAIFKENPGVLFAAIAITSKYFLFNPAASREYQTFLGNRSPTNFADLWKANPGLISGALVSLGFVFEWGIRSLVWNPDFAAKDFMFAKDAGLKDISLTEADRLLSRWPGLVYGIVLLTVKYGLVNFSARQEYLDAFKAIGGVPETGQLFLRSPGIVGFTIYLILKFLEETGAKILFDPRLIEEYKKFWKDPSLEHAKGLFSSGALMASLFAIGKGITGGTDMIRRALPVLDQKRFEAAHVK